MISDHGIWSAEHPPAPHAYSVPLASWIAGFLHNERTKLLRDFGCGDGAYLARLKEAGFTNLVGYEGDPPKNSKFEDIRKLDLCLPVRVAEKGNALCLEVAEHIPAGFESQLLFTLMSACAPGDKLILSWATPGQPGEGHINCRPSAYVETRVSDFGFTLEPFATAALRSCIWQAQDMATGHLPWFKTSSYVFIKVRGDKDV